MQQVKLCFATHMPAPLPRESFRVVLLNKNPRYPRWRASYFLMRADENPRSLPAAGISDYIPAIYRDPIQHGSDSTRKHTRLCLSQEVLFIRAS